MKTTLPILTLFILLGGLLTGAERLDASQCAVFSFNTLPDDAVSFEDLDARDNNNQPVVSFAAKEELQSLFQSGLFTLLVQSEIPSIAKALSVIRTTLNLAAQTLRSRVPECVKTLLFTLLPSVRRQLDKTLVSLSGIFGLFVLTASTLLSMACLPRPPLQSAFLVLRC
jgi:hypothetical protein